MQRSGLIRVDPKVRLDDEVTLAALAIRACRDRRTKRREKEGKAEPTGGARVEKGQAGGRGLGKG